MGEWIDKKTKKRNQRKIPIGLHQKKNEKAHVMVDLTQEKEKLKLFPQYQQAHSQQKELMDLEK